MDSHTDWLTAVVTQRQLWSHQVMDDEKITNGDKPLGCGPPSGTQAVVLVRVGRSFIVVTKLPPALTSLNTSFVVVEWPTNFRCITAPPAGWNVQQCQRARG